MARSDTWQTTVQPITDDVLGAVQESARELGLPAVAVIQLTRAWLVVEGEHDRKILNAFYDTELTRAGVQVLALRGAARAKASFLNLGALENLGLPFFVLLDNARADALEAGKTLEAKTEEERIVEQLQRLRNDTGVELKTFGLRFPDVICCLPFEAARAVAEIHGRTIDPGLSWEALVAEWAATEENGQDRARPNFKAFVLQRLGLASTVDADAFVDRALEESAGPRDGDPLYAIVSEVIASTDARSATSVTE